MGKKVLVTKEFHRKALRAIERDAKREMLQDEHTELLHMAWISYMETQCSEEQLNGFAEYCEAFLTEFG